MINFALSRKTTHKRRRPCPELVSRAKTQVVLMRTATWHGMAGMGNPSRAQANR
jgi:hypothetical protein